MLRSANSLKGYAIHAIDGDLGKVHDLYFDDLSWTIRYVVVDTGGWLTGRRVLISPAAFGTPEWTTQMLPIKLTKAQIEESPPVDAHKPLSRQMETQLSDYFGWPSYWAPTFAPAEYSAVAGRAYARAASSSGQTAAPAQEEYDPHLRSVDEVTGYRIQANDGGIGHVEDFIVDDFAWVIRYLVVDTRNWLPGRKVLLTPDMIDAVRWDDQTVHVHLTRAQIKKSPEYDPAAPINREYETRLYDYYGRPSYWL